MLSACGGSEGASQKADNGQSKSTTPTSSPAAKGLDSCALVTKQEVAAALGQAVTRVDRLPVGDACQFGNDRSVGIGVEIVDDKANIDSFKSYVARGKEQTKTYPVSDLGDAAFLVEASLQNIRTISLQVLKGRVHFALIGLEEAKGQEGKTQPLPAIRALALQVISRID